MEVQILCGWPLASFRVALDRAVSELDDQHVEFRGSVLVLRIHADLGLRSYCLILYSRAL